MGIRQFWFSTVLITTACVLVLFFFPLPQGSFISTHGPVTALRALQALYLLTLSAAALAARIVSGFSAAARSRADLAVVPSAAFSPPSCSCLRC